MTIQYKIAEKRVRRFTADTVVAPCILTVQPTTVDKITLPSISLTFGYTLLCPATQRTDSSSTYSIYTHALD